MGQGLFIPRSLEVAGRTLPTVEYLPPQFDPSRPWPLLLYLHSSGERGQDLRHVHAGLGLALQRHAERFPCLAVLPQCPEDRWWTEGPHADVEPLPELVDAALESVLARYPVDPRRVVLTGISMGGYGTWIYGARHFRRFAALVPICGGGCQEDYPALCTLPIWAFHGALDETVPPRESRAMWDMVREAGGEIRYTEYSGVGHECWDLAYGDPELAAWMMARSRPPGEAG